MADLAAVEDGPLAAPVGGGRELGPRRDEPGALVEQTDRPDLVEHAVVVAKEGGVGHVAHVLPGRPVRAVGPVAEGAAFDVVHPPDRGRLGDGPGLEELRPQHCTQQPHRGVAAVAPPEARVVGGCRAASFEGEHPVHVDAVGKDLLRAAELARRPGHPLVEQEQLGAGDAQIGVHPVVLEPHGAVRRIELGIRPVPASKRRLGRVALEQPNHVAEGLDHVA